MDRDFTLPGLQSVLDSLPAGQQITLARSEVDRLFGLDDVGSTRLLRFAGGHRCAIIHSDNCVVFEKQAVA